MTPSNHLTTDAYIDTSDMCIEFYYYIQDPESTDLQLVLTAEDGMRKLMEVPKLNKTWIRYFIELPSGIHILNIEIKQMILSDMMFDVSADDPSVQQFLQIDTGTSISFDDISVKPCTQFGMYRAF